MLDQLTPYLRHVLQIGAGALTTRGIIDASLEEALVGVGVSIFTFVWAYFARRNAKPLPTP
jgi:hypothetical protein